MKRIIPAFSVFILLCLALIAIYSTTVAQTDDVFCMAWNITGQWNYQASAGGYGTMQFLQDTTTGKLTGSWHNVANQGSGDLEGEVEGVSLGFIPYEGQNWQGTVNVDGSKMTGTYTHTGYDGGTWEATGNAQCLQNQPPPPPGTVKVIIRWGDNLYRYYPGAVVPTINFLGTLELGFEVVVYGTDLPDKLKVYDDVKGSLNYLADLNPAGETQDGGFRYTGKAYVRPMGAIGIGDRELHKVRIGFHKDYQELGGIDSLVVNSTPPSPGSVPGSKPNQIPTPTLTPTPDDVIDINQYLIDPSGYIYDSSDNGRIEVLYLQTNPQVSDEEGRYGWEVPEGDYLVRVSKSCYADVESEEMHIPPPRTDVNLGLTQTGCSDLKVTDIWTADKEGLRNETFNPGEQIELHNIITSTGTSDISVELGWTVTDPQGKRVESMSGTGTYAVPAFGTNFQHDVLIPSGAAGGTYGFITSLTNQNQTSFMSTQFEVVGGGVSSSIYLPLVVRTAEQPKPTGGIGGQVSYNGAPASGIELDLRYYDGSGWSTALTTMTGSDGRYLITRASSLGAGEKYYVRFGPNNTDDRYLYNWYCPDMTTYTAGESVLDCNFDVGDITLVSPPPDAVVSLPVTFTWQKRGIPGDTYGMRIFLPDGSSTQWESGDLGDVNSYTLTFHPGFVNLGEQYAWDGYIYNGSNGYGTSYWGILFEFSSSQTGFSNPSLETGLLEKWNAGLLYEERE